MATELNNLDKLTDKIFQNGIEKANKESDSIISEAKTIAQHTIQEAKNQALEILSKARHEADEITKQMESEIRLKSKQLLSDLKNEITELLSKDILNENTVKVFMDTSFIKSMILEVIDYWKSTDNLELILPTSFQNKIDDAFKASVQNNLKHLTITFDKQMKDGFRVVKNSDSYELSFTEEDFISFFKSYLTPGAKKHLFNEST